MKRLEQSAQFGGRQVRAVQIKFRLFAVKSAVTDQHQPQLGRRLLRFLQQRLFQVFEVVRFLGTLQSNRDEVGSGLVAGLFPKASPLLKVLSELLLPRRTDHEENSGLVLGWLSRGLSEDRRGHEEKSQCPAMNIQHPMSNIQ